MTEDELISSLKKELASKDATIKTKDETIKELTRAKDEAIKTKDEAIKAKDDLVADLKERLAARISGIASRRNSLLPPLKCGSSGNASGCSPATTVKSIVAADR